MPARTVSDWKKYENIPPCTIGQDTLTLSATPLEYLHTLALR
ncbi:hypothetical protein [Gemmiger sp. An50]|nr:hypothetical protein [Gemmiger sp. An50]